MKRWWKEVYQIRKLKKLKHHCSSWVQHVHLNMAMQKCLWYVQCAIIVASIHWLSMFQFDSNTLKYKHITLPKDLAKNLKTMLIRQNGRPLPYSFHVTGSISAPMASWPILFKPPSCESDRTSCPSKQCWWGWAASLLLLYCPKDSGFMHQVEMWMVQMRHIKRLNHASGSAFFLMYK